MFKRLATSITKPPLAVFFIKDTWVRIILYLFFIPLIMTLPITVRTMIDPGMNQARFERMTAVIRSDFQLENTEIVSGILIANESKTATFDFFTLIVGDLEPQSQTVTITFDETELIFSLGQIEFGRKSYLELGLSDYDFSVATTANSMILGSAIRQLYDEIGTFGFSDIALSFMYNLFDYVLYVFLMAVIMVFFAQQLEFTFLERVKLSTYLSSIFGISSFILALFGLEGAEIISIILLYVFHLWAYRSIHIVRKEPEN
jgi:glycosyltransferase involved in cell wall biosynthesis